LFFVFFSGEMISVLDFCKSELDTQYVHVVTGLSKLGWSGAKVVLAVYEMRLQSPRLIFWQSLFEFGVVVSRDC
jgi:hypothetical protein